MRVKLQGISSCLCLIFFALVSRAHGDSITFRGASFALDAQQDLRDGNVKVVIRDRPLLLAKDGLERSVALEYLSREELVSSISSAELASLINESVAAKDTEMAAQGLAVVVSSHAVLPVNLSRLIEGLVGSPHGSQAIAAGIRIAGNKATDPSVCLSLQYADAIIRELFAERITQNPFLSSCHVTLTAQALECFGQGDLPGILLALRARSNLPFDDLAKKQIVATLVARIEDLQKALGDGRYLDAVAQLEAVRRNQILAPAMPSAIPAITVKAGEESLSRGDFASALFLLSYGDFKQRTPQQHLLLSQAIQGLSSRDLGIIMREPVRGRILMYASNDDTLRREIADYIDRAFPDAIANRDTEAALSALSMSLIVQGDTPARITEMRQQLIAALLAKGETDSATLVVKQLPFSSTGLWMRIKVAAARGGIFGTVFMLLGGVIMIGAVLLLSVILGVRFFRRVRPSRSSSPATSGSTEAAADGESEKSGTSSTFVAYSAELRAGMPRGEYESLLADFGLSVGATAQDIKLAYRSLVKEAHPDRNPHAGDSASDLFITISEKYDRLLILHEQQGKS